MSKTTKLIFLTGITLLAYSYLCRTFGIYFFWDSRSLGWIIVFIGLISYLVNLNRARRIRGKKTIWVKIGIWFLLFGFLLFSFVVYLLKTSEAYQTVIDYLRDDPGIKNEVGNVKGFGLIVSGEVETSTINDVESGYAEFFLTIRGDRKYKDVTVTLKKTSLVDWTVISVK